MVMDGGHQSFFEGPLARSMLVTSWFVSVFRAHCAFFRFAVLHFKELRN